MDVTFIPTPQDSSMKSEASIVKSASFAGTAFDFGSGFAGPGVGLPAALVAQIEACTGFTAGGTITLTPMESADNQTFTACGPGVIIASGTTGGFTVTNQTLGTTVGALALPFFQSSRYFAGSLTIVGTGTITLSSWVHPLGTGALSV